MPSLSPSRVLLYLGQVSVLIDFVGFSFPFGTIVEEDAVSRGLDDVP